MNFHFIEFLFIPASFLSCIRPGNQMLLLSKKLVAGAGRVSPGINLED
jgi:hypothetical protein